MENRILRQYRDRFRCSRWTSAHVLALMDITDSTTSKISALVLQYSSTLPLPTSFIQFPSTNPAPPGLSSPSIQSSKVQFGPTAHSVHRVDLKRTWNTAFSSLTPPATSPAAFVDSDVTAQHVTVGSHLSSVDVTGMTLYKRRQIRQMANSDLSETSGFPLPTISPPTADPQSTRYVLG